MKFMRILVTFASIMAVLTGASAVADATVQPIATAMCNDGNVTIHVSFTNNENTVIGVNISVGDDVKEMVLEAGASATDIEFPLGTSKTDGGNVQVVVDYNDGGYGHYEISTPWNSLDCNSPTSSTTSSTVVTTTTTVLTGAVGPVTTESREFPASNEAVVCCATSITAPPVKAATIAFTG